MEALEAIRKRRSVRRFTGEPVSRQDLETIVDAGRLAASGKNIQPWEFIVITDQALVDRLEKGAECHDAAAIIAVVLNPATRWWVEDGAAAVQNMLIAVTALGYGACWMEGYTQLREEDLKQTLGIPAGRRLLTIVPVGIPAEWPDKEKKTLDAVLHWEKY